MLRWIGIITLGVLVIVAFFVVATSTVHARDYSLSITNEIPTSTGIAPAPSARRYYEPGGSRIARRPDALIGELFEEAPANGCEASRGGFRSESGGDRGRCY